MLTVVAPLQLVVASSMLCGQPAMEAPVLTPRQTIIMGPVVPPLEPVVLPIVAVFEAIMAAIMRWRIALMGDGGRRYGQGKHGQ
jgi:hypothetical protein